MKTNISSNLEILTKLTNRSIGIWGLGVVGCSVIRYLSQFQVILSAMDRRSLTKEDHDFLTQHHVSFFHEDSIEQFFHQNDYVVVSPGINHTACQKYKDKIISELDIFSTAYKNPIIAITGSVGKTSTVHLLDQILNTVIKIQTGGNIGLGMLDLISEQENYKAALLELSSFQLNQCTSFSPDLAIWTNFYPNHLDWHGSQEAYFQAKLNIIRHQTSDQQALLPLALLEQLIQHKTKKPNWYFMSTTPPLEHHWQQLKLCSGVFYIKNNQIVLQQDTTITPLIDLQELPQLSYIENWVTIYATLQLLHIPSSVIESTKPQLSIPEHRLEKVATVNNVDFYDDSKSTAPAATEAAVQSLCTRPIILLLGGISKGIDRTNLIAHMSSAVKLIICFGKERDNLKDICQLYNKTYKSFQTLDEALKYCLDIAQPGDQVLLSPAGASFDQFENYKERGNYFKKLVREANSHIDTQQHKI